MYKNIPSIKAALYQRQYLKSLSVVVYSFIPHSFCSTHRGFPVVEFDVWDGEGNTLLLRLCLEVIKLHLITQPAEHNNLPIFF